MSLPEPIWSGVFESFLDAQESVPIDHVSTRWIDRSIERLEKVTSGERIFPAQLFSSSPLVVFPALLNIIESGLRPVVVDYGGNLGQLGIYLRDWFGLQNMSWTVVERQDFLSEPRIIKALPPGISFCSNLADAPANANLIHFGSSIQYVENLDEQIGPFLSNVRPSWITVADLMGSDSIEPFVTRQRYAEGYLLSQFRNLTEFRSYIHSIGYETFMIMGSLNEVNRHYYPETALPEIRRIDYPSDLVFCLPT